MVNPSALMFHAYVLATAVVVGVSFGTAFALVPLGLGFVALIVSEVV